MRHLNLLAASAVLSSFVLAPLAAAQSPPCPPGAAFPCLYCDGGVENNGDPDTMKCWIDTPGGVENPLTNLQLGTPLGADISPDGLWMYVANNFGDTYSVLGLSPLGDQLQPVRSVNLSTDCSAVDVELAGTDKLYVACFGPGFAGDRSTEGGIEVFVKGDFGYIDVPGPIRRIPFDELPEEEPATSVTDITASADGRHLYVAFIEEIQCVSFLPPFQLGTLAIVDTATDQVVDRFPDRPLCSRAGQEMLEPLGLGLSRDGRKLYVALHSAAPPHIAEVALSAAGDRFEGSDYTRIPLCSGSECTDANDESQDAAAILVSSDGSKLYVTHNGLDGALRSRISVVNTSSRVVSKRIQIPTEYGFNPAVSSYTRDGSRILVPMFGSSEVPGTHVVVLNPANDELDVAATILIPRGRPCSGSGCTLTVTQPVNVIAHPFRNFAYTINNIPDNVTTIISGPVPKGRVGGIGFSAMVSVLVLLAVLASLRIRRHATTPDR